MAYQLPLEITREDQIWLAHSSAIQDVLATGDTFDALSQIVPDVTEALYAVCREKGWAFVRDAPDI